MAPSFDLATDGFCRVRWLPGQRPEGFDDDKLLSLRELFVYASTIADVEVSPPPALAGFLRVLYVIAARVSGLDTVKDDDEDLTPFEEWEDRKADLLEYGRFDIDTVERYFRTYEGRFKLFANSAAEDPVPFLQDPRLLEQCRSSKGEATSSGVNKLVLARASGQGFVWQSHTRDAAPEPVPAPEAVFSLLTWLYFGAPGRCTPRQVGDLNEAHTKGGPLRGTVSYHPKGENLFETLVLGVPFLPCSEGDAAAWEEELPNQLGVPPKAEGIGRVLAGRFHHAVLLSPSAQRDSVTDARITWARKHPHGPVTDPFLVHHVGKNTELFPSPADADRAVWRDLEGLLTDTPKSKRPQVLNNLDALVAEREWPIRITALGFDQDRSQAKDRQYFAGTTPVLLRPWRSLANPAIDPEPWERLRRSLEKAETTGSTLRTALSRAWWELSNTSSNHRLRDNGVEWLHTGMARYWSQAEELFWSIVLAPQRPTSSIANQFIRAGLSAYSEMTEYFPRTWNDRKVIEKHRALLWRGWDKENNHG
ncbi:type I-E CRISPR-associated protein Cse1/CasA [Actinopolyspora mortivallis]|uniref:Type I-E CRISPR-associated protein Cse1/CasA n=1 Tax=Actinopolyspora mortivallis TaxID=33906 RepID=A0A2T0H0B0_ACTMO|nr:type I-E CRISPR-associated protein Cse1/CasA [Actinopolyspora mortivallis]PRW64770.1 type I-E CRISPR-associated protein Cse1/CasA [Actinopolyspora mortivallis]